MGGGERAGGRWLVPIAGLAAALPVIVSTIRGVIDGWTPTHDAAYIAASSYDVFSLHTPLIGRYTLATILTGHNTYSPGPLLYWLLAIPARILPPISLEIWMGTVNTLAVVAVLALARRRGGLVLMFATGLAVAVMCGSLPAESLRDIWNPYAALFPFMLLLFLCWSIACGDYKLLPAAVVVASFVAQCHLSIVVASLGALIVGGVGLALSRRRSSEPRESANRWVLGAAAAGLVCWSLPLADLLTRSTGNLIRVANAVFSGHRTVGLTGGWYTVVRAIGMPPWWMRGSQSQGQRALEIFYLRPGTLARYGPTALALGTVILFGLVLLVVAVAGARRRRGDVAAAAVLALVVGVALFESAAATPANGLVFTVSYTLLWASPVGMWVWLVIGFSLVTLWIGPAVSRRLPVLARGAPAAMPLLATVVLAATGTAVAASGGTDPDRPDFRPAKALADRLNAAIPGSATVNVESPAHGLQELVGSSLLRPVGVAIYTLRRHGDRVLTPYEYYMGEPNYSPDHKRTDLLLDIRTPVLPPPIGEILVARMRWADMGMITASIAQPPGPPSVCPYVTGPVFAAPTQTPTNVEAGRVTGFIDSSQVTGGSTWFCGWAANLQNHRPADLVEVAVNGHLVDAIRPTRPRPDVAASEHGAPVNTGFSIWVPTVYLGSRPTHARVTLYGVEGGVASPLGATCTPGGTHDIGC